MKAAEWKDRLQSAPICGLHDIIAPGGVLILAPHPDDESLGCGGLIAQCVAAGLAVGVAILTDGAASHPDSLLFRPARLAALREDEARVAVCILGVDPAQICFFGHPDGCLSRVDLGATEARLAQWASQGH